MTKIPGLSIEKHIGFWKVKTVFLESFTRTLFVPTCLEKMCYCLKIIVNKWLFPATRSFKKYSLRLLSNSNILRTVIIHDILFTIKELAQFLPFRVDSESLIPSFLVSDVCESLRSLTKIEWCEQIAQVSHQKWATMSYLITSLRGNEWSWANRSGRSPKMSEWVNCSFFWANRSFAHFWAKNKCFARKTDERIPSPAK